MVEYSILLNGNLYEDELPEDLPEETYDLWYDLSIIPDGVGCRVGPALERNGKVLKHNPNISTRLRALAKEMRKIEKLLWKEKYILINDPSFLKSGWILDEAEVFEELAEELEKEVR